MPPDDQTATLAVLVDRVERIQKDFAEQRELNSKEFEAFRKDMADLKTANVLVTNKLAKAEGGYMILLGFGSLVAAVVTVWDKIWSKTHG